MGRHWRWAVVAALTAALVGAPFAVAALPAGHDPVSARTLLQRIIVSGGVPYSGYARSTGGLALPVSTGAFSVNDLLGGTTRLRVWWRGTQQWRVDSIKPTGETDLHHVSGGVWTWDYESGTAQWSEDGPDGVRLPRADDLVPGNLARRLLSESRLSSATRLPDTRIAGHDAAGVRVTIADRRSTIRHIDVWALPANGLPLRVAVYGQDATPVVSTTMYDLGLGRPPESTTAFVPIPGTLTRVGGPGDIVAAIDELGRNTPPASLAGLPRRTTLQLGGVGVYGRGVTLVAAVPLSARLAATVVPQLRQVSSVVEDGAGIGVGIGAVNVQLSPPAGFGARWLLVGTVTLATLRAAAVTLPPAHGFGFGR